MDNDPVVISHIRALLASDDGIVAVEGDLRDPEAILATPELAAVIDMRQPVCVLLVSVLHFVDEQTARKVAAGFMRPVPAGSYLVLSAGTRRPGVRGGARAPLHRRGRQQPHPGADPGLLRRPGPHLARAR